MVNSGLRELTINTYSKRVFCDVMLLVVNCTSTCANYTSGSHGQKGGSLMLMAATAGDVEVLPVKGVDML